MIRARTARRFKEAIELFHEIEGLVGSSSALCENMGHTFSSMGDYPEAPRRRDLGCAPSLSLLRLSLLRLLD